MLTIFRRNRVEDRIITSYESVARPLIYRRSFTKSFKLNIFQISNTVQLLHITLLI